MNEAVPEAATGTTILSVLIALGVLCVLAYSVLAPRIPWELDSAGLLSRLRKRKDRLLRAIKDAEFERAAGGLSEEEFRSLRNELKERAIQVTKDLERARRFRFQSLIRKGRGITPSQKKHVEDLVQKRVEKLKASATASPKGEVS